MISNNFKGMPKPYLVEYELDWVRNHKKGNRTYVSQQKQNRTILEKLIADPGEVPSSSGTIKKCNRFDDVEQKIGYNFQEMKHIARSNINRLQDVMSQMEAAGDSRAHGIGSVGGHIARLMKDPGPTNGHYIMAVEDPFLRKSDAELIPKLQLQCGKELNLPEWNHRFLEGGNVLDKYGYVTDSTPERLTRISSFRQEILKYRMNSSEVSKSDPNFSKTKTKKSTLRASTGKIDIPAARSTDSNDDDFDSEEDSLKSADKREPVTLVMLAEELWRTLLMELKESAHSIQYSDLIEINALREPPEMVINCIGYICLLLDLEPTWQAARCALFKEFRPFQNFLREVDPLSLPVKRIQKAFKLKAEKLHHVTIHALAAVCRPLAKVMRWVIAFNNIAQLIVAVETRKEANGHGSSSSVGIAAAKSDVSTAGSQQSLTKKQASTSGQPSRNHTAETSDDVSVGSLSSAGLPPELKLAGDVLPIAENLARFFQDLSQEQATLQAYYSRKDLKLYAEWVRQNKQREMLEVERLAEEEEYEAEGFDDEDNNSPSGKQQTAEGSTTAAPVDAPKSTTGGGGSKSASGSKLKKAGSVGAGASGTRKQLSRGSERHRSTGSSFSGKLPAVVAGAATAPAASASVEDDNEDWLLEMTKPQPTSDDIKAGTAAAVTSDEAVTGANSTIKDNDSKAAPTTPSAANSATKTKKKKSSPEKKHALPNKHKIVSASVEALISAIDANGGVPPSRLHHDPPPSTANNSHSASKRVTTAGTRERSKSPAGKTKKSAKTESRAASAPTGESMGESGALLGSAPKDGGKSNSSGANDKSAGQSEEKEEQGDEPVVVVVSPIAQLIRETASSRSPPGGKRTTITVKSPTAGEGITEGGRVEGGAGAPPGSAKQRLRIGNTSPEALKKAHPSTLKSRDQLNPLIVLTKPPKPEPTPAALPEHIPAIAKLKPKAKLNIEKAKGTAITSITSMHTPKTTAPTAPAAPVPDTSLESLLAEMEELEPLDKKTSKTKGSVGKKVMGSEPGQTKAAEKTVAPVGPSPVAAAAAAPPAPVKAAAAVTTTTSPTKEPQIPSPKRSSSSKGKQGSKQQQQEDEEADPYGEDEYEEYGNDEYEQEEKEEEEEVKQKEVVKVEPVPAAVAAAAALPAITVVAPPVKEEPPTTAFTAPPPPSVATAAAEEKQSTVSSADETKSDVKGVSTVAEAKESSSSASGGSAAESKYTYKDTPSSKHEEEEQTTFKKAEDKSQASVVTAAPSAPSAEAKPVKSLHLSLDEFVLPSPSDLAGSSATGTPAVGGAAVGEGASGLDVNSARFNATNLSNLSADSLDATTAWNHADNIKLSSNTTKPTPQSSVYSAAVSTRSLENELDSMFVFDTPKAGGGGGAAGVALSSDGSGSHSSSGMASASKRASPKKGTAPDTVNEEEQDEYGDAEFDEFES